MTVGCAIFLLARGWSTAMGGTPSDNSASDFSADISLLGLTPYARHGFLHGRIPSLENCILECAHTIDLPSGH